MRNVETIALLYATPALEAEADVVEAPAGLKLSVIATTELSNNTDSLEADLAKAKENNEAAQAEDATVDEGEAAVSALEAFLDTAQSYLNAGGMDKNAADFFSKGTSFILESTGFSDEDKPKISLEAFEEESNRSEQTTFAMDSVKEKISEIIAAIIAVIKKSIAWLAQRFAVIFSAANSLKSKAKAIKDKASKSDTIKRTSGGLVDEELSRAFRIGQHASRNLPHDITQLEKMAEVVLEQGQKRSNFICGNIVQAMDKGDIDVSDKFQQFHSPLPGFKRVENLDKVLNHKGHNGLGLNRSYELLGGVAVYSWFPEFEHAKSKAAETYSEMSIYDPTDLTSHSSEMPIAWLTTTEVEQLADSVIGICDSVLAYKEMLAEVTSIKTRAVKAAERLKDIPEEAKTEGLFWSAQHIPRMIDQPAEAFSIYALRTCRNLLQFAELSLAPE